MPQLLRKCCSHIASCEPIGCSAGPISCNAPPIWQGCSTSSVCYQDQLPQLPFGPFMSDTRPPTRCAQTSSPLWSFISLLVLICAASLASIKPHALCWPTQESFQLEQPAWPSFERSFCGTAVLWLCSHFFPTSSATVGAKIIVASAENCQFLKFCHLSHTGDREVYFFLF